MALSSVFQDAFTAPTSARDVGQEMLHAILLLSCAFIGWCASSALISALGWFPKDPDESKAKQGSGIFRQEVVAYVQANSIDGATKHFGLSHAEIRNCIDALEQAQYKACNWKVGQLWQSLQEVLLKRAIPSHAAEADSEAECAEYEDVCTVNFTVAPSHNPGLMLLEQYGVFGATSGMWSGSVVEDASKQNSCFKPSTFSEAEEGSGQNSYEAASRIWVPLEYTW